MTPVESSPAPVLHAQGLGLRYRTTTVLDGVDLDIETAEQVAISGRSGSGKTTLLLVLAGLLSPSAGTINWPGLAASARERRSQIGMIFQAPSLMPELTAVENVALPLRLRGIEEAAARESSMHALAQISADAFAQARPAELSGGQQQRVAIARALAGNHRLVLADEPTGALDREHAREVVAALCDTVRGSGATLVVATHDPELADALDRRLVIVDGRLAQPEASR